MDLKRGFVTVATGDYYCWLAQNLAMSYRLFSKNEYPIYAMTDKKGEKKLKKYFDGVIVLENPDYTFMDKIAVYDNSPFEETIFLDADMNITRDICFLFDEFSENGSDVSCVGKIVDITDTVRPVHFGSAAIERFGLTYYIDFGGGIYYYRKGEKAEECIRFIYDALVPDYHALQMKVFRPGQLADEPMMELTMLVHGMKPLDTPVDIMKYSDHMMDSIKWDMKKQVCSFEWRFIKTVTPIIVHYGTHNTRHKKYVYFNSIVRCKYLKIPILTPFYLIYRETRLLFIHLKRPQDMKAFRKWFFDHFTKQHFEYRKSQIKKLLKGR